MANRKTVDGIKLVKPVDEATRSKIRRAGDLEKQIEKAFEMNLLDADHYKEVKKGLQKVNLWSFWWIGYLYYSWFTVTHLVHLLK